MNVRKSVNSKNKFWFYAASAILVCVLWLGGSIWNLVHNKLEMNRLQKKRVALDAQYEELKNTFQKLQEQDPQTLERLARTEYNMANTGEYQFRFDPND